MVWMGRLHTCGSDAQRGVASQASLSSAAVRAPIPTGPGPHLPTHSKRSQKSHILRQECGAQRSTDRGRAHVEDEHLEPAQPAWMTVTVLALALVLDRVLRGVG